MPEAHFDNMFNFIPRIDASNHMPSEVWDETIHQFPWLHRLTLGIDKSFHLKLYTLYGI